MKKILAASVVACLMPLAAVAHHGHNNQFDSTKELEVSGVVTEIKFVNPHSYVYFDVTKANGEVETWHCEMRAANVLKRSGWSAEMFEPGTPITVTGIASRKEATGCYAETLALGDHEAIGRYEQIEENKGEANTERPARTAWGVPNIGGNWAAAQNLAAGDGPSYAGGPGGMGGPGAGGPPGADGGMGGPPGGMGGPGGGANTLSEAGQAAMARLLENAPEGVGNLDCKPRDFFSDWIFDQHTNLIVQEEDKITMKYGFMDTVRVIHLDLEEHPQDITPSFAGHSIGKWEGDVLVVDTVGFPEKLMSRGPRIAGATSGQYQVTERFSVDNEAGTLTRSYTAEDPLYWVEGHQESGEQTISLADYPWEPYACKDLTVQ